MNILKLGKIALLKVTTGTEGLYHVITTLTCNNSPLRIIFFSNFDKFSVALKNSSSLPFLLRCSENRTQQQEYFH